MEQEALEIDQAMYTAIGRLAVAWANLEYAIDHMVMVFHFAMGNKEHEAELPRALNRKLEYLRVAFKRYFPNDEGTIKYGAFLELVEKESDDRHDIIHGAQLTQIRGTGEAQLERLLHRKTHWERKPITITTAGVMGSTGRVQNLQAKATAWAVSMLIAYHAHLGQPLPPDVLSALQSP